MGLVLLIAIFNHVSASIITQPPVDTTVCYGELATFYCESNREDIATLQWHINGFTISQQEREMRRITTITNESANSTLSIAGLPVNNGVTIDCIVVTKSFLADTALATLTLTNIPPVDDIFIVFSEYPEQIMTVTWSPPSCIPVNYTYIVTVIISDNTTVTDNTTDTQYTMEISQCSANYTVSVIVKDIGYTDYQSNGVNVTGMSNDTLGMYYYLVCIIIIIYYCYNV